MVLLFKELEAQSLLGLRLQPQVWAKKPSMPPNTYTQSQCYFLLPREPTCFPIPSVLGPAPRPQGLAGDLLAFTASSLLHPDSLCHALPTS